MPIVKTMDQHREVLDALNAANGIISDAARNLNLSRETLRDRIRSARKHLGLVAETDFRPEDPRPFTLQELPSFLPDIKEILERRLRESRRKIEAADARELIEVRIGIDGPFGILHFGDPHLDDPGTDMDLVLSHMELVKDTPALYAACVGDFINNWRGKLNFLHANQSTTQAEALVLLEWFIRSVEWLYLVGGNHDVWHGDGDPLRWIAHTGAYEWHQCRIALRCPNGREIRVNARHDWPGRSMYGAAHGPARGAMFDGRDHIYIAGHIHDWENRTQENSDHQVWHAIRVASYKRVDDHALKIGYASKRYGAAVMTVFDPYAENESDLISVHWSVEQGAELLKALRAKFHAASKER